MESSADLFVKRFVQYAARINASSIERYNRGIDSVVRSLEIVPRSRTAANLINYLGTAFFLANVEHIHDNPISAAEAKSLVRSRLDPYHYRPITQSTPLCGQWVLGSNKVLRLFYVRNGWDDAYEPRQKFIKSTPNEANLRSTYILDKFDGSKSRSHIDFFLLRENRLPLLTNTDIRECLP